jgi:SM-20-related protein
LLADGVAVRDRFLTESRVRGLIDCADRRHRRGDFSPARIGADEHRQRREEIRGDRTCWLAEPLFPEERALLCDLDQLRLALNRRAFLGLLDLELHYAWYPPGAGYERHLDQLQGKAHRRVSLILYLNERWHAGAGGELRLFAADGTHRDVEPLAGRLACFLTAGREHAVLTTQESRLSITGWFRQRA